MIVYGRVMKWCVVDQVKRSIIAIVEEENGAKLLAEALTIRDGEVHAAMTLDDYETAYCDKPSVKANV